MSIQSLGTMVFLTPEKLPIPVEIRGESKDKNILNAHHYEVFDPTNQEVLAYIDTVPSDEKTAYLWIDHIQNDSPVSALQQRVKRLGTVLLNSVFVQSCLTRYEGHLQLLAHDAHFLYWSLGFRPLPEKDSCIVSKLFQKIYEKIQRNQPLDSEQEEMYNQRKERIAQDENRSLDEVSVRDVCFKSHFKEIGKRYKMAVKNGMHAAKYYGDVEMYLPEEAIEQWKSRIRKNPEWIPPVLWNKMQLKL